MAVHDVRSWSHLFQEMQAGRKKHDLRKNDRDYKVGDLLMLHEYDNINGRYTGRKLALNITYITGRTAVPCAVSSAVLDNDYVILSVERA
jgi:hypothetical protein